MKQFLLLLLCASNTLWGAVYNCSTEFGETVPVDFTSSFGTLQWNPAILKSLEVKSEIKKREISFQGKKGILRTRYAKQTGPAFQFQLSCKSHANCKMNFLDGKEGLLLQVPKLFDERLKGNRASATVQITRREHKGLIVRLTKEKIPFYEKVTASSSSGELKMFNEDPKFSLDVGTDEQLVLPEFGTERIAAIEIKINCSNSSVKR